MMKIFILIVTTIVASVVDAQQNRQPVYLGEIPDLSHGVGGKVYALDDRTLEIKNLNYDGQAPDAYFWVGTSNKPDTLGSAIPDENGSLQPLKGYRNANIILHLPAGKTLKDIKYFGLWCRAYSVNFGHVPINQK